MAGAREAVAAASVVLAARVVALLRGGGGKDEGAIAAGGASEGGTMADGAGAGSCDCVLALILVDGRLRPSGSTGGNLPPASAAAREFTLTGVVSAG